MKSLWSKNQSDFSEVVFRKYDTIIPKIDPLIESQLGESRVSGGESITAGVVIKSLLVEMVTGMSMVGATYYANVADLSFGQTMLLMMIVGTFTGLTANQAFDFVEDGVDNFIYGLKNGDYDSIKNSNNCGGVIRFKYEHNPSDNPKVLRDAIEDPNAVYGYRPREGGSLSSFVDGKWDDPIAVEGYRQDRIAYHNRNEGAVQQIVLNMIAEGASLEDIARAVNEYRNQSRINSYIDSNGNIKNIDGYKAALARAEKNSYENLIKSGKTPEQIIKSATKGNPAMDACTGLYDEYFDTY